MEFLKKATVGLFGVSMFCAGAAWVYVILTARSGGGVESLATKGFFAPIAAIFALCGIAVIIAAIKMRPIGIESPMKRPH